MSFRVFLSELKRRQVYRAVIVYATLAWVLLEGADIVFPRLGFADESVTLVLILVCIGFPIALYLAWVYDITPDGIFRTPPLSPEVNHEFSWARIAEFLLIGALAFLVGYLYLKQLTLQERLAEQETVHTISSGESDEQYVNPETYRAIAVLPFADMSEAGDQDWFAEGIAEELLLALSQIESLSVIARTSSFAFRNTDKTIAEIADILDVQAVLEGSVRRSGERVRITAQLIDANSGYHIWSGSYEHQLTNIFAVQDKLARSVIHALRIQLGMSDSGVLVAEQTRQPEAYNALIRGRTLLNFGSPENVNQSISYFEKAVAADPGYALAWGYLAWARSSAVFFKASSEVRQPTIEAYQRALVLDPDQGEALAAKAWMAQLLYWDWQTANELYRQAMEPRKKTTAMIAYGMYYLGAIDRLTDAISVLKLAEKRDPLNPAYKATLAYILLMDGNAEAAIQKAGEALDLNPKHVFAIIGQIDAYLAIGDTPAAEKLLGSLSNPLLQHPRMRLRAAFCHVKKGDFDSAREIYQNLIDDPIRYGNILVAQLALSLGEVDQAIDSMEWEVEQHSWNSLFVRALFRHNEAVRDNARYLTLLKKIGLDDESVAALHNRM